jgi:cytochrome bd-type quinol oxidase subunit 2
MSSTKSALGLKWNLLWYIPLCLTVLLLLIRNASYDWEVIKIAHQRWVWAALVSPSAALCFGVLSLNLLIPFQLTVMVSAYFNDESESLYQKRYLLTCLTVVAIVLVPLVVEFIVWGSFPFNIDAHGNGRLRWRLQGLAQRFAIPGWPTRGVIDYVGAFMGASKPNHGITWLFMNRLDSCPGHHPKLS